MYAAGADAWRAGFAFELGFRLGYELAKLCFKDSWPSDLGGAAPSVHVTGRRQRPVLARFSLMQCDEAPCYR